VTEAACLGAALLAGVGAGCYPNAIQAAETVLSFKRTYEPHPARAARYEQLYQVYRSVYPTVAPIRYRL
jgi:xylulokinase